MTQQPLDIRPSQDALDINAAHKVLRDALGTPREELARAYHARVVEQVKRRNLPAWCCASGCQDCSDFAETVKPSAQRTSEQTAAARGRLL